jgi:hypothetical protein
MVGEIGKLGLRLVAFGLLCLSVSSEAFAVGCASAAEGRTVHHSDGVRNDFLKFPAAQTVIRNFPKVIAAEMPSKSLKFVPRSWVSQDVTVVWLLDALRFARTWHEKHAIQRKDDRDAFWILNQFLKAHMSYVDYYTHENYPLLSGSVERMLDHFGHTFRVLHKRIHMGARYKKRFGREYLATLKGYESELAALIELPDVQNFSFGLNYYAPVHGELSSAAADFHARLYPKIQNGLVEALSNQTKFKEEFPYLSELAGDRTRTEQYGFLMYIIGKRKELDALVNVDGKFYIVEVKNGRRSRKAIKEQILALLEIRKLATGEDGVPPFEVGALLFSEISPTVTEYLTNLGVRLFWPPNFEPF